MRVSRESSMQRKEYKPAAPPCSLKPFVATWPFDLVRLFLQHASERTMPKMETQTSRSAIKSPVKSLDEQPRVHTPVPAEFHHHHHHRHHNPPASQEDTLTTLHAHAHPLAHRHLHGQPAKSTTLDLEVEMKIKTQEIQGIREEVNQLEAKLLHDAEVRSRCLTGRARADRRRHRYCRSRSTSWASSRES